MTRFALAATPLSLIVLTVRLIMLFASFAKNNCFYTHFLRFLYII